mmetsp:Transcript_1058/g.3040  ORF Transcript_1058/g.3040 Transcript_1058/m.3040 type:complete len:278 (-) Transcript_1058:442-1275(-)
MGGGMKVFVVRAVMVVVAMGAALVAAQDGQCACSSIPSRACTQIQLTSTGPDACTVVDTTCGGCVCDAAGTSTCDFVNAFTYEFIDGSEPLCSQTAATQIATCPFETATFTCATSQAVQWVPPLTCTISAASFPAGATLTGATMSILETANGTATLGNQKGTQADGSYRAFIFQTVLSSPAEGLFGDWTDIDTGDNVVSIAPFTDLTEFVAFGPATLTVPANDNFTSLAQPLIDGGTDIVLTLTADSQLTSSPDFTSVILNSAFATVDVTIQVTYTT